jgi:hypothetical protein
LQRNPLEVLKLAWFFKVSGSAEALVSVAKIIDMRQISKTGGSHCFTAKPEEQCNFSNYYNYHINTREVSV